MDDKRIGSGPIEPEYKQMMNALANGIDNILNGKEQPKKIGFVLLMFNFGDKPGRCNYISNADRNDVKVLLREQLAYFEGMPEQGVVRD